MICSNENSLVTRFCYFNVRLASRHEHRSELGVTYRIKASAIWMASARQKMPRISTRTVRFSSYCGSFEDPGFVKWRCDSREMDLIIFGTSAECLAGTVT